MISNWTVLQTVAQRYGSDEDKFQEDHEKLTEMRYNNESPLNLEKNQDRIRKRIAREGNAPNVLERINGSADFQDVYVFELLNQLSKAVCRITQNGSPLGTGFLVAENIILTNHHVIESAGDALSMSAEFDYELAPPPNSDIEPITRFDLNPASFFMTSSLELNKDKPFSGLDFTLVALNPVSASGKKINAYTPVLIDGNIGKIIKGESCIIIQHPDGKPKKVVLKNAGFFSETETSIVYETDTLPGSSGSMVVALGTCEIIALHHAGLPRTDADNRVLTKDGSLATPNTPDSEIDWIGNEGIKISQIINAVKAVELPAAMEPGRAKLLRKTDAVERKLATANTDIPATKPTDNKTFEKDLLKTDLNTTTMPDSSTSNANGKINYLITAIYTDKNVRTIEAILKVKYGNDISLKLAMPGAALLNHIELFALQIFTNADAEAVVKDLVQVPGILNAELDAPIALNADNTMIVKRAEALKGVESNIIYDDGYGTPNESEFINKYTVENKSPYVKTPDPNDPSIALANRQWNWRATNFDKVVGNAATISPKEKGIRIVQFDTGYTDHPKVFGGFDFDHDANFLDDAGGDPNDASDPRTVGILKFPGHGTRTGSLLIGNKVIAVPDNGNCGLLSDYQYKLTPYRIAETVIIINRQQQLASALDTAMTQGFDIITMSMGLPPTIATAKMAKKAYDKGIIWCCAAGNEVQFVVAPAVYPGTIAVAASNPLNTPWKGSSRGDAVDITAPGEDVYVPILYKDPHDGDRVKDEFSYGNGTSYATPHVAAAAAYWLAKYQGVLNNPDYGGWKRVEAFKEALRTSAKKMDTLPTNGFGHGMLDVEELLKTEPLAADKLKYAYDGWNENAFFAMLQGSGQIVKTYWNKIHGWIFGTPTGAQESLQTTANILSTESKQLEQALFGENYSQYESTDAISYKESLRRLTILNNNITSSAKK